MEYAPTLQIEGHFWLPQTYQYLITKKLPWNGQIN